METIRVCRYCQHNEPGDLCQQVGTDWSPIGWVCADTAFCDIRSWMRGLWTGAHLEVA